MATASPAGAVSSARKSTPSGQRACAGVVIQRAPHEASIFCLPHMWFCTCSGAGTDGGYLELERIVRIAQHCRVVRRRLNGGPGHHHLDAGSAAIMRCRLLPSIGVPYIKRSGVRQNDSTAFVYHHRVVGAEPWRRALQPQPKVRADLGASNQFSDV
jgi:hypothetical protein